MSIHFSKPMMLCIYFFLEVTIASKSKKVFVFLLRILNKFDPFWRGISVYFYCRNLFLKNENSLEKSWKIVYAIFANLIIFGTIYADAGNYISAGRGLQGLGLIALGFSLPERTFRLMARPSRPRAASTRPLPAVAKRDSRPGRFSTA